MPWRQKSATHTFTLHWKEQGSQINNLLVIHECICRLEGGPYQCWTFKP